MHAEFGCYIDRHGIPLHNGFVVPWECKATRFTERKHYILLFSPEFVEIRHKASGRLVQVIEGQDIRLLNAGIANLGAVDDEHNPSETEPILMARLGKRNDVLGQSIEFLELLKTSEIGMTGTPGSPASHTNGASMWK